MLAAIVDCCTGSQMLVPPWAWKVDITNWKRP
jgi:hypothetical protein